VARHRFAREGHTHVLKLLWLNNEGVTVAIDSQRKLHQWLDSAWCSHPLALHVIDEATATTDALDLADRASSLFEQYDDDQDGFIDMGELGKLLQSMRLTELGVTEQMVGHFVSQEFRKADVDGSGKLDFDEFCRYYNALSDWARVQLVSHNQHVHIYKTISEHYLETSMTPAPLSLSDFSNFQGEGGTIESQKYGVKVNVGPGALKAGADAKLAVGTLLSHRISHLVDEDGGAGEQGEYPFTPIVELRCEGMSPDEDFLAPVELMLPHAFHPDDGQESVVMLGAKQGATEWSALPIGSVKEIGGPDEEGIAYLKVSVMHPGIYCAFSSPEVEDTCSVRLYVMIAPKIAPYRASSVRVHLCPTLPDQLEEVELEEHCEWGLVKCAGTSQILRLPQGAAVVLEMDGEVHTLQWMGLRTHVAMMYDPRGRQKQKGTHFSYDEIVTVKLAKGVGRRAALGRAQAIKAGIPEEGLEVPFNVEVQHHTPPSPPQRLKLLSRTPSQFTVGWMPPRTTGGAAVHHYAVELELLTNKGVRRGFKEVWEGDYPGDQLTIADHAFHGYVRVRCWNIANQEPSGYSDVVELPKLQEAGARGDGNEEYVQPKGGKKGAGKPAPLPPLNGKGGQAAGSNAQKDRQKALVGSAYGKTAAAATHGRPGGHGVARPLAEFERDNLAKVGAAGPAAQRCTKALAAFYVEAGAEGGRDGVLFGLRVSHVALAMHEGRAAVGVDQPLVGLVDVALHDALLPLAAKAVVLEEEWNVVVDRCLGFVELVESFPDDAEGEVFLRDILYVMLDIYETLRACQKGGYITLHLEEPAYKADVKEALTQEAVQRLTNLYWKFSTDVLKILMQLKTDVSEVEEPEDILAEERQRVQARALRRQQSSMARSALESSGAFQAFSAPAGAS